MGWDSADACLLSVLFWSTTTGRVVRMDVNECVCTSLVLYRVSFLTSSPRLNEDKAVK